MHQLKCLRDYSEGLQVTRLLNGRMHEAFITIPPVGQEDPTHLLQRLYEYLEANPELRIVRQDVFGEVELAGDSVRLPGYRLDGSEWPLTWVIEGNGGGGPVAGIQVHALAGTPVKLIRLGGGIVGAEFEDAHARYCVLGGVRPDSAQAPRPEQAWQTLAKLEQALALVGMDFSHVFRTWFYLDDILSWYGEFNLVRNRFFRERGVFEGLVPASTGVGGSNASGTAVVADLLAVALKDPQARIQAVPSPLQCPALEYGSSFSRAVELALPGQRRLYVSGTASIAPDGRTACVGDVQAQVDLTMDVVEAILSARGLEWSDVTRAIGYFKHTEEAPAFARWCAARGVTQLPTLIAKNDICRDDLLFEIEVDAIRVEPGA